MKRSVLLPLLLAAGTLSSWAFSQTDPATARVLFNEGRKLTGMNQYAAACPKFEESYRLDPGMGTLFNLADCWEHIGRTASAWARFLEVADTAGRAGQKDREQIARGRATTLEPKLSRLVVEVKAKDNGLELSRDGQPFGAAQWGTALPIDPGAHTVEARAPQKQPWKTTVDVPANGQTVRVVVQPLPPEVREAPPPIVPLTPVQPAPMQPVQPAPMQPVQPAPMQPVQPAPMQPVQPAPMQPAQPLPAPPLQPVPEPDSSAAKTAGWVLVGAGAVGLAVGAIGSVRLAAKNSEADAVCPTGAGCSKDTDQPRYESAISDAKTARTIAIVGFAVGGVGLAAGTIVLLTASARSSTTGWRVVPGVAGGTFGTTLQGAW
jgi:hypothetical protein